MQLPPGQLTLPYMLSASFSSSKRPEGGAPVPPNAAAPQPNFPDFATMHVDQPNHILRAYERNFAANNPNISADVAPLPDKLVRPPPSPTFYWVVTAGEQIGLCHNPGQVDLSRIFLLPKFAMTRFDNWEDAVKFYAMKYKNGNLCLMKFLDAGYPDKPIAVPSTLPTPVPPKKSTRFAVSKDPPPPNQLAAKTRVRKNKTKESKASASAPPRSQTDPADSSGDLYVSDSPPKVVVIDDSDELELLPQPRYPVTPAPSRKRPYISPLPGADQDLVSPTLAERGSPCAKGNRANKKARAISEPPFSNEQGSREDSAVYHLQPLVFVGLASARASPASQQPEHSTSDDELDDNDPELPAYPFHASQRNRMAQVSSKGKGKGKARAD